MVRPGTSDRVRWRRLAAAVLVASTVGTAGSVTPASAVPLGGPVAVATVSGTPWEIVPLPSGESLVVQRDGGIVRLGADDRPTGVAGMARTAIPHVRKLLGLALAPDFPSTGTAYLYVGQDETAIPTGDANATGGNGIWRLHVSASDITVVDQVFDGIPSDGNHDGGRMVFGPDGARYVTTGDIHQPSRPQDVQSLNGKILRFSVPSTGQLQAPADNPYVGQGASAGFVWSLGHRHPQGLAFDAAGQLWETEHGPTGEMHGSAYPGGNNQFGRDELNLIVRGGNYGWPLVSGPDTGPGLIPPAAVAGSAAWAPGDLAVGADGSLYAPFLAGERLHRFDVQAGRVVGEADDITGLGRLRVTVARGSTLLVATDNNPGTGLSTIYRMPVGTVVAAVPVAAGPVAAAPAAKAVDPAVQRRVRTLGRTVARQVVQTGRRALARGREVAVRVPAPAAGRTVVRLRLGGARGPVLARTARTTTGSGSAAWRLRLDARGRARVAGRAPARPVRITVVVRYRDPGGSSDPVIGTDRVSLR